MIFPVLFSVVSWESSLNKVVVVSFGGKVTSSNKGGGVVTFFGGGVVTSSDGGVVLSSDGGSTILFENDGIWIVVS